MELWPALAFGLLAYDVAAYSGQLTILAELAAAL